MPCLWKQWKQSAGELKPNIQLIKKDGLGAGTYSLGPASRCGHVFDAVVLDWTWRWIPPGVQSGDGFIIHNQVGGRGMWHWKMYDHRDKT